MYSTGSLQQPLYSRTSTAHLSHLPARCIAFFVLLAPHSGWQALKQSLILYLFSQHNQILCRVFHGQLSFICIAMLGKAPLNVTCSPTIISHVCEACSTFASWKLEGSPHSHRLYTAAGKAGMLAMRSSGFSSTAERPPEQRARSSAVLYAVPTLPSRAEFQDVAASQNPSSL